MGRHFRALALGIEVARIHSRLMNDWAWTGEGDLFVGRGDPLAIIVRSGRPPKRLAVPAIRSHDQTDRPRPSRCRSGPGGQHGRDRPDWRRVVHRPADLKKVISSIARPSMMAGRRPNKHAGDMFWAGLSTLLAPLAAFSERGVKMAVFHGPQAQSWRCRYFVPASILLRKRSASLEPHRRGHFGAEFANLLGSAG